jgi:hypothetical protein
MASPVQADRGAAAETAVTWRTLPASSLVPLLDGLLILAGLAALFLLPAAPPDPVWTPTGRLWHDGVQRHDIVEAFVHGRPLGELQDVHPGWSGRWPLIGTLLATPLWYLGSIAESPSFWLARYNWFLFSVGLAAVYLLLRSRVDRRLLTTFLLVLTTGSLFASHLAAYLTFEPFTAVLVTVGSVAVATGRGWLGWPLVVVGVANMPTTLVGLGLAVLVLAARTRRLRYLAVPLVALALILLDNWVRTGSIQPAAYAAADRGGDNGLPYAGLPGFSYPFFFGLLAILFSFGRGLVFYAPGLFLPVRRSLRRLGAELWTIHLFLVAFVVGLVLVYARWWGWNGGFFWGPRFFLLAAVPASLALAVRLYRRPERISGAVLDVGLVLLSGWIAISGAVFGMSGLPQCEEANALTYQCDFVVTLSPLWHPLVGGADAAPRSLAFVVVVLLAMVRLGAPSMITLGRLARLRWTAARAGDLSSRPGDRPQSVALTTRARPVSSGTAVPGDRPGGRRPDAAPGS